MSGQTIADIEVGKKDGMGQDILTVYHKVDEIFAIYSNADRMVVKYADDGKLASEQRLALSHLAPLRGEINGLVEGWRETGPFRRENDVRAAARARRYDRRVADALVVALQGDQATAELVLLAIQQEIMDERVSVGRVQHVLAAGTLAFSIFVVFGIMHTVGVPSFVESNGLWLATGLGCLGAFFSIAIAIRDRTVHTDLRTRDNVVDAGLRVLIGAISAVVLFSIFKSHILTIAIMGDNNALCVGGLDCKNADFAIVIGFLAGFSERLVGDLLSNKLVPIVAGATAGAAATAATVASVNQRATASEVNPMGKGPEPVASAPLVAVPAGEPAADEADHEHGGDDYCLCDEELADLEITDDVELPQASGGVEAK